VLRRLRALRREHRAARSGSSVDAVLVQALESIRALDLPHFELEEPFDDSVVH
jgi:hypothetical protein